MPHDTSQRTHAWAAGSWDKAMNVSEQVLEHHDPLTDLKYIYRADSHREALHCLQTAKVKHSASVTKLGLELCAVNV